MKSNEIDRTSLAAFCAMTSPPALVIASPMDERGGSGAIGHAT